MLLATSRGTLVLLAIALAAPALADQKPTTHHHARAHRARHAEAVSPIKPLTAPPRPAALEGAAPTPDENVTPPPDRSGQETSVKPAVMQIHYPPMGDGYTSGSSAQAMDDREAAKVTGVQVQVPLGQ
jgi:hypothetical protein